MSVCEVQKSSLEQGVSHSLEPAWYVYLIRAVNGALYCGITTDPKRRFAEHQQGKGARFFRASPAQKMVYLEACANKGSALRREIEIKRMKKVAKERLVMEQDPPD